MVKKEAPMEPMFNLQSFYKQVTPKGVNQQVVISSQERPVYRKARLSLLAPSEPPVSNLLCAS